MPKSAKIPDDPTEGAVVHVAVNGINELLLKGYVTSIEAQDAEIKAIMDAAAKACQPFIDEIKAIKKAAAVNMIPKKPLNAKLAERKLLRKAEGVTDALNDDQKEIFAEISAKLGDLPMFAGVAE
jgi:SpoVK/Ycf46/Vps4 family AAA+-type ATPase